MKSKLSKKEILQLIQDEEEYQLNTKQKSHNSSKKQKQEEQNTKWDIVLLVIIVIVIYFILYKVIMIVIEIKIVNQNTQHSPQPFVQRQNKIQSQQIANVLQHIQEPISNFARSNSQPKVQIVQASEKKQEASPLKSKQQIQKIFNQQKLKAEQQELLNKLRQNMLQQAKLQQNKGSTQNTPSQSANVNVNQAAQQQQAQAIQSTSAKNTQPMNRAGISGDSIALGVKFINLKNLPKSDPLADTQRQYYQKKYHISQYTNQIPFCVVVPSYNNVGNNRYLNNINSILQQQYQNYHIIFIDDASTDETFNKMQEFLKGKELPEGKIKLIRNQKQMFAMYNLRKSAMEYCKPEEIFMIVDGDDELLGRQVFKFFNAIFQEKQAYFVYTNFITIRGSMGYSRQFPDRTKKDNIYRNYPFVTSHLRAYYTKLFQLIEDKDLRDDKGQYYHAANDVAICIPILQMAHTKVEYIPQLNYVYNSATGLNNHKLRLSEQKSNDRKIRSKKKYEAIQDLFSEQVKPKDLFQTQNKQQKLQGKNKIQGILSSQHQFPQQQTITK